MSKNPLHPIYLPLMKGETVAKGWEKSEQRKLSELKILTDRILHQRDIERVNTAVNVV